MILFKPYTSIKGFLQRYTLFKIGNMHIRIHKITDRDRTTLYHNHPFNYISIIIRGGYTETYIKDKEECSCAHSFLGVVKRAHDVFHRIDSIKCTTITLFIAYGKYRWEAFNTKDENEKSGVCLRTVNGRNLWCKRENGVWFIGNTSEYYAAQETRHSIHQFD